MSSLRDLSPLTGHIRPNLDYFWLSQGLGKDYVDQTKWVEGQVWPREEEERVLV